MKIFENKTQDQKENAIKKGTTLPKGAVNLRMVFIRRNKSVKFFECC